MLLLLLLLLLWLVVVVLLLFLCYCCCDTIQQCCCQSYVVKAGDVDGSHSQLSLTQLDWALWSKGRQRSIISSSASSAAAAQQHYAAPGNYTSSFSSFCSSFSEASATLKHQLHQKLASVKTGRNKRRTSSKHCCISIRLPILTVP